MSSGWKATWATTPRTRAVRSKNNSLRRDWRRLAVRMAGDSRYHLSQKKYVVAELVRCGIRVPRSLRQLIKKADWTSGSLVLSGIWVVRDGEL